MRKISPIWLLIFLFSVIYAGWSVNRHNHFQTDAVDLAIFDQPLWHYSRFESPLSTVKYNQSPGEHILGDHFHPVLALLSFIYWIRDDVRLLLVAQAVFAVFSVYPIYKIARLKIESELLALSLSFAYLTFIGFQTALDYDFHETSISILPFSLAAYYLLKGRHLAYFLSLLIGVLIKEDMPLFFSMLGLFTILRLKRFKVGLATFMGGLLVYFLIVNFFIPFFKHDRFAYEELDPRLGKTTVDLILRTITNPLATLTVLVTPPLKFKTILNLLASFAFLPLLSPLSLIMTLPNLASRFLTRLSQRWLIRYQYSINLTPVLALSVIFGLEDLRKIPWVGRNFRLVLRFVSLLLIVSPIVQTVRTRSPLTRILNLGSYKWESRFDLNYRLISQIPSDPNVSVMAQSSFVPHLSHRYRIFRYEDGLAEKLKPDYILMSLDEASDPPYVKADLETKIKILRDNTSYSVLYFDGSRLLMRFKGGS